ncbi:MAG: hypothetical protein HKO77_08185 [Gemmatimonadetes bacterium]|nr:hypothetical protein [Gemmatimonadota bacterium]
MRRHGLVALLLMGVLGEATALAGQAPGTGQSGPRALMALAEEVALARSAAPASVSDDADIWVLERSGYRLAVEGTNGVACMVSRDWIESVEPICYDPEAAASIMQIAIRRLDLLHAGRSVTDVDRLVAEDLFAGRLRLPQRPALAYMMSRRQQLIDPSGNPVGPWQPHLMIYHPFLTAGVLGLPAAGAPEAAMVFDEGTPTASMVIVVPAFTAADGSASRR